MLMWNSLPTIILLLASYPAVAQWTFPESITKISGQREVEPDIAASGDGTIHVVYFGGSDPAANWRAHHMMRAPGGPWQQRTTLNNQSTGTIRCAPDKNNNLHVVYTAGGSNDIYHRRRDPAGNWTAEINLSNTPQRSYGPDVAVDSAGRIFVVWLEDIGSGESYWELYMRRFDGGSWQPMERLTNDPQISADPAIAVDANDTLHLTWTHDYLDILYRTRTAAGVWSAVENINPTAGNSRTSYVAVTPAGVPHLVWHDNRFGQYDVFHSTKVGGNWITTNLSNHPSRENDASIVIVGNTVHVIYIREFQQMMYTHNNGGAGWIAPVAIPHNGIAGVGAMCADASGRLHAVWQDNSQGDYDIVYTTTDTSYTPVPTFTPTNTPTPTITLTPTRTNTPRPGTPTATPTTALIAREALATW